MWFLSLYDYYVTKLNITLQYHIEVWRNSDEFYGKWVWMIQTNDLENELKRVLFAGWKVDYCKLSDMQIVDNKTLTSLKENYTFSNLIRLSTLQSSIGEIFVRES